MSKIIIKAALYNGKIEEAKNKYYLHTVHTETVSFSQLIKHITEHGTSFNRGTVMGVMLQAIDCIKELVMDSKKVELGDMGTFYVAVHSTGSDDRKDCTIDTIENVYIRFQPSRAADAMLDSKSLRRIAKFNNLESTYVAETGDDSGSSSSGSSSSGSGNSGSGGGSDSGEMPLTPQP